jgi:hypothetical protein
MKSITVENPMDQVLTVAVAARLSSATDSIDRFSPFIHAVLSLFAAVPLNFMQLEIAPVVLNELISIFSWISFRSRIPESIQQNGGLSVIFQATANLHSSEPLQVIRILIELPLSVFRVETNPSRFV